MRLTPGYLRELADEGRVHPDSWSNDARASLRIIADELDVERHTLATIRAEYARYLTHHDTYELARAIGQVLSEPVDVLPEDQRVVVRHPDDEEDK